MTIIIVPILEDDFEHHIVCKIINLSVSSTFSSSSDVMFYLCLCTHFFFSTFGQTVLPDNKDKRKPDAVWVSPIKLKTSKTEMAVTYSGEW